MDIILFSVFPGNNCTVARKDYISFIKTESQLFTGIRNVRDLQTNICCFHFSWVGLRDMVLSVHLENVY